MKIFSIDDVNGSAVYVETITTWGLLKAWIKDPGGEHPKFLKIAIDTEDEEKAFLLYMIAKALNVFYNDGAVTSEMILERLLNEIKQEAGEVSEKHPAIVLLKIWGGNLNM